jgi:predicted hydrocarbon binding protein
MNRRKMLKQACGLGLCACAAPALLSQACAATDSPTNAAAAPASAPKDEALRKAEWWLSHSQKQTAKLWELLATRLDEKTRQEILEQLGRNCARNLKWAEKYKGNPEGFFQFMSQKAGEQITYDREKGIITVVTRERDCDCRLANSKITPPIFCACSVGWQKHTYETILGKPVDAEVKESVLRGSKRCVFEVRVGG